MEQIVERIPLILSGLGVSVAIGICALGVALMLGLLGAAAKLSKNIIFIIQIYELSLDYPNFLVKHS